MLVECIKTIITDNGEDFEVIVSDNNSIDNTEEIVRLFEKDNRIKYYKQNISLSMRENFEASLLYCSGDYITILGDDDGLAPDGLNVARDILGSGRPDIFFWWPQFFWWENAHIAHKKSLFYISKPKKNATWVDPKSYLHSFLLDTKNYWLFERLPSIYNGFVKRTVIQKSIADFGKYFHDELPDVGSGIYNSIFCQNAIFVEWPITIRGISGKSTGLSARTGEQSEIFADFKKVAKKPIFAEELIESNALIVSITSCKINAIKQFGNHLGTYEIKIIDIINGMLHEAIENKEKSDQLIDDARNLALKYNISIDFDLNEFIPIEAKKQWGWTDADAICVNCEALNIKTIHDAHILLGAMASYKD